MENSINKKNWWIIIIVAAVLAFAVVLIQQKWLPDPVYALAAFLIAMVILGVAFYWIYTIDREGLWWAQIPAMVMVVLLATGIVGYFTPKDASNSSPYGVVTLGLGSAIIGLLMKRPTVKLVMYVIAMITLVVGFLMLPFAIIWRIVLIVIEVVVIGYLIWQNNRQMIKK